MKKILAIAIKEWRNYFTSPVGYIFAALLLIVVNWLYFNDLFLMGQADMRPYLTMMVYLLSIFIPSISMNLLADEKRNSTWEVLLTTPITELQMVLGKFLGCGIYLLFTFILTLPTVVTIFLLGKPEAGLIIAGYLGLILIGLAYLSVGLFMSSLSNQPIIGFLGSAIFLIISNLISQEMVLMRIPMIARNITEWLSLTVKIERVNSGLITMADLMFFFSWITIFLILTIVNLKTRDK